MQRAFASWRPTRFRSVVARVDGAHAGQYTGCRSSGGVAPSDWGVAILRQGKALYGYAMAASTPCETNARYSGRQSAVRITVRMRRIARGNSALIRRGLRGRIRWPEMAALPQLVWRAASADGGRSVAPQEQPDGSSRTGHDDRNGQPPAGKGSEAEPELDATLLEESRARARDSAPGNGG